MITVIYRMCDITSSNESPVYWDDKLALNRICLKSFVQAFYDIKPTVKMICDRCPPYYEEFIHNLVPEFPMTIEFTNSGIRENAVHQYDYVTDDNEIYLFQECDYMFRKDAGKKMIEAAKQFDFITGYDHPDKYKEGMIPSSEVRMVGNQHWRVTDSTTSTFMARGSMVKKEMDLFRSYGWDDHKRWLDLGSKGYKLWSPIPSLTTHMVKYYMAPGEWESEWENL